MKIGIIGAGQIGGTLTRRLRALGHEVQVANSRDPSTLASLVTETGAVAVEARDAPRGADLVIVTIPERNVPTLPPGLFASGPARVVIVDPARGQTRSFGEVGSMSGLPESGHGWPILWVPALTGDRHRPTSVSRGIIAIVNVAGRRRPHGGQEPYGFPRL